MSDLAIDTTGDIVLTDDAVTLVTDADAIAQNLRIRLRMFRGEWFLNPLEGMPYLENVFQKNPKIPVVAALFRRAIRETPGVAEVVSFVPNYDAATRTFSVSFEARVETGEILTFTNFVIEV
jgi:hypothetical protein